MCLVHSIFVNKTQSPKASAHASATHAIIDSRGAHTGHVADTVVSSSFPHPGPYADTPGSTTGQQGGCAIDVLAAIIVVCARAGSVTCGLCGPFCDAIAHSSLVSMLSQRGSGFSRPPCFVPHDIPIRCGRTQANFTLQNSQQRPKEKAKAKTHNPRESQ